MGGTWVHWHMPHIYREISYYGLHNDWIVTQNPGSKEDYFTVTTGDEKRNCSHDEEVSLIAAKEVIQSAEVLTPNPWL